MAVTLRDVAKAAGFSVTTVSRALNDYTDVNEETRQHIKRIAAKLGYAPNASARQLQTRRAQALGFVIPTPPERLDEPFFLEFLSAAAVKAARHNYDLLVTAHAPDQREAELYRRLVKGQRVDGMILVRIRHNDPRIELLRELGAPCALFGRGPDDFACAWIDVDGKAGTREAVEHLIDLGHRRIAYLAGPERYIFATDRYRGYEGALQEAGIPVEPPLVQTVEHLTEKEGYERAVTLLSRKPAPTAIAAVTDLVAFGVLRAVHEAGLRPGADVAVVGFDGLEFSAYTNPPLSTVAQPIATIGRQLVEVLLALIEEREHRVPTRMVRPTLVVRESTMGTHNPTGRAAVRQVT